MPKFGIVTTPGIHHETGTAESTLTQAEPMAFGEIWKPLTPTLNVHVQQKERDPIKKVQQNYPGNLFEGDVSKKQEAPQGLKMQFQAVWPCPKRRTLLHEAMSLTNLTVTVAREHLLRHKSHLTS